jgi:hypothetical protein
MIWQSSCPPLLALEKRRYIIQLPKSDTVFNLCSPSTPLPQILVPSDTHVVFFGICLVLIFVDFSVRKKNFQLSELFPDTPFRRWTQVTDREMLFRLFRKTGRETWSLTQREEQGAEENIWALEEESGRRLHNEKLRNLYASQDIIRVIKPRVMWWAGHVAHTGEIRNAYRILVGASEIKKSLGRSRHRWEENIRMDL